MPKQTQNQPQQISSAAEVIVYIAERLKLARSIKHMTLESVAGRLGITRKQLQNYESAQSNISVVRLWELANVLDTEPGFYGIDNSIPYILQPASAKLGYAAGDEYGTGECSQDRDALPEAHIR